MTHPVTRLAIVAIAIGVVAAGVRADEPTLADVLARAGAYVTSFQRQLSGIVAEETYVQDVHDPPQMGPRPQFQPGVGHRELKSDLLLVKPEKADRWIQFRDVFEVDGKPVRDRSERLIKLFVEPSASTASQAEQIVTESSRYNIGNILRTINVPVFALLVLDPARQPHFTFTRANGGSPGIGRDMKAPDGAWVVKYEEAAIDTLITTAFGRNLPCHGRFWIDPATGRVLMSELIAEDFQVSGTIVVKYQQDLVGDALVPVAMHERYIERRNGVRTEGDASYARFRQFQVKVDEKIAPIKERE
jgi:hypothetical protein